MTGFEFIMSCVGMILCALICCSCVVVIAGLCWWAFKRDMQEEEQEEFMDNSEYDFGHDVNHRQEE